MFDSEAQVTIKPFNRNLGATIIAQALSFGADLAGIAPMTDVIQAPSFRIRDRLPEFDGVGTLPDSASQCDTGPWPAEARSAIVIAVAHPPDKPELDWWITGPGSGNTAGNRLLMDIVDRLAAWLEKEAAIMSYRLPYHLEKGGVYMKDAAVMAGLGCIGRNNLLITPRFGPRLRLRVMLVDALLSSTGPIDYDPCSQCPRPCMAACPQQAFSKKIYDRMVCGIDTLPGRTGTYDRLRCNCQMESDEVHGRAAALEGRAEKGIQVKYCRSCELACPAGNR